MSTTLHAIGPLQIKLLRQARDELEAAAVDLRALDTWAALNPRCAVAHTIGILTGLLRGLDEEMAA